MQKIEKNKKKKFVETEKNNNICKLKNNFFAAILL